MNQMVDDVAVFLYTQAKQADERARGISSDDVFADSIGWISYRPQAELWLKLGAVWQDGSLIMPSP